LKLIDARFVTSAVDAGGIPRDGVPHVALVGRSNVGKSSLINALARNKNLARTSAAAGKTRLANLYRFDVNGGPGGPGRWSVYFADLPGYGYARGGRDSVEELRIISEAYFSFEGIAGVLHLVDARHPGLEPDVDASHG
jgi:GTP-binding protein